MEELILLDQKLKPSGLVFTGESVSEGYRGYKEVGASDQRSLVSGSMGPHRRSQLKVQIAGVPSLIHIVSKGQKRRRIARRETF